MRSKFKVAFVFFFVVIGIHAGMTFFGVLPAGQPALTDAQVASEARYIDQKEAAARAVAVIRKSVRDPDSLVVEQIFMRNPPNVVCIAYRAKNGFGGVNRTGAVVSSGVSISDPTVWNKRCVGDGFHDIDPSSL